MSNAESKFSHRVPLPSEKGLRDFPPVRLIDVPKLGQVGQEGHRLLESFAALQHLRFVYIIREKDLAIRDMLIDLVLGVGVALVGIGAQLVAEPKEVGDISRDYWNCETVEESVEASD